MTKVLPSKSPSVAEALTGTLAKELGEVEVLKSFLGKDLEGFTYQPIFDFFPDLDNTSTVFRCNVIRQDYLDNGQAEMFTSNVSYAEGDDISAWPLSR